MRRARPPNKTYTDLRIAAEDVTAAAGPNVEPAIMQAGAGRGGGACVG